MTKVYKKLDELFDKITSAEFNGGLGSDYSLFYEGLRKFSYLGVWLEGGDHSIMALSNKETISPWMEFGDGASNVWLSGDGAWDQGEIRGGDGDHAIRIENVGKNGTSISVGDGSSAIILNTIERDIYTDVNGGNGNFHVKANGLSQISLGNGDHVVNVGSIDNISLGHGNSNVAFASGLRYNHSSVYAGNGNHTFIGEVERKSSIELVFGDSNGNGGSRVELSGSANEAFIFGGAGSHFVFVEEAKQLDLHLGNDGRQMLQGSQTVFVGEPGETTGSSGYGGGKIFLGHGDHLVDFRSSNSDFPLDIFAGNGNSQLRIGDASTISLGNGNHAISAGNVASLAVGHGNSHVQFENGLVSWGSEASFGDGQHEILAVATVKYASTQIEFGDANEGGSIARFSGKHAHTSVNGGDGDHRIWIDRVSTADIHLEDGNQVIEIGSFYNGQAPHGPYANINLGDGDHCISINTRTKDVNSEVVIGDGDSHIVANGLATLSLGNGDHVIQVGESDEISTGRGNQKIFFEDGRISGAVVETGRQGDDLVVGVKKGGNVGSDIYTYAGDDIIVLLNGRWKDSQIDGGGGYDTLYIDDKSKAAISKGEVSLHGIEEVVFVSSDTTVDDILAQLNVEVLNVSFPIPDFEDPLFSEISNLNTIAHDFDLEVVPDSSGVASALLKLVDYPDGKLLQTQEPATREGRLMESTDDFFLRINAYEATFSADESSSFYSFVRYNEFGDFSGTNSDDNMVDDAGNSQIFAMGGNDNIDGGVGDDRIYAGTGNDMVRGGDGQDLLDGGAGFDFLIGGAGIDIFVFRHGEGTTVIEDFELSLDILDVEGFDGLTYEALTETGRQVGGDTYYELGEDTLILRNIEFQSITEIDLCMR